VSKGVGTPILGRFWGRAGVVVLASAGLVAGCATSSSPLADHQGRSVGANVSVEAPTEASPVPFLPPPPADAAMPTAPETFTGPPPVALPPAPQLREPVAAAAPNPTGTGVWAVVIGINDYPGSSHDLESARNDASDMDAALSRYHVPPQQRVALYDGQAPADTIRRGLDWLVANAGPDATVVFFYAGHVRKLAANTEALVGADGRVVSDAEVADRLAGLRAGRAWIVVAACYGGGFNEALAPGRILTAAAGANQIAYESTELHRSYLGEYLTHQAMLQGHADDSVEQAFAWAVAGLRRDHPDRLPVQFDQVDGDLVLGPVFVPPPPTRSTTSNRTGTSSTTTTTTTSTPPRKNDNCLMSAGTLVSC
jgi:hypothetical protein